MILNKKQAGFSLIEVLIGMLLLTVGILGMASLQINAKRLGNDALQRSLATTYAHDMIERMRANPEALGSYVGTTTTTSGAVTLATITVGGGSLGDTEPTPDCRTTACDGAQLAIHDLWEWERVLDGVNEESAGGAAIGGLLTPRGCITVANGLITTTVAWDSFQTIGNPTIDPVQCGVGENPTLYGINDEERQVVFFTTFINF